MVTTLPTGLWLIQIVAVVFVSIAQEVIHISAKLEGFDQLLVYGKMEGGHNIARFVECYDNSCDLGSCHKQGYHHME